MNSSTNIRAYFFLSMISSFSCAIPTLYGGEETGNRWLSLSSKDRTGREEKNLSSSQLKNRITGSASLEERLAENSAKPVQESNSPRTASAPLDTTSNLDTSLYSIKDQPEKTESTGLIKTISGLFSKAADKIDETFSRSSTMLNQPATANSFLEEAKKKALTILNGPNQEVVGITLKLNQVVTTGERAQGLIQDAYQNKSNKAYVVDALEGAEANLDHMKNLTTTTSKSAQNFADTNQNSLALESITAGKKALEVLQKDLERAKKELL